MITVRTATPARPLAATAAALAMAGSLLIAPSALAAAPPELAAVVASSSSKPALLRQGSTGVAVREWQKVVNVVLGRDGVAEDGIFGPRTTAATRKVQKLFGLAADGIVGPRTRAATDIVQEAVDPIGVDPTRIADAVASVGHLELGDRGARVEQWQRLLDVDPRSTTATLADGIFGRATLASTKAFQARYGLAPDGVVGPSTRAKMQEVRDDV